MKDVDEFNLKILKEDGTTRGVFETLLALVVSIEVKENPNSLDIVLLNRINGTLDGFNYKELIKHL